MTKAISKKDLEDAYIKRKLTMKEVSEEMGVSVGLVHKKIHEYGIPIRGRKEAIAALKANGWVMPEEKRRAISEAHKGKKLSERAKRLIAEAHKGKYKKPKEYFNGLKGGNEKLRKDGYVAVYVPDHPNANKEGYVMKHRLIMEQHIGRFVGKDEIVHHKNHDRADNRIENLEIMSKKEHAALHMTERHKANLVKYVTTRVRVIETGEEFESIREAADKFGCASNSIIKSCKTGCRCKGVHWERVKGGDDLSIA